MANRKFSEKCRAIPVFLKETMIRKFEDEAETRMVSRNQVVREYLEKGMEVTNDKV
jgi:hypothetical protein